MKKDKVTSEDLRKLVEGQAETFELPDAAAINSAKSNAYRMQHLLKCRISASSDYEKNTLTLKRLPKT